MLINKLGLSEGKTEIDPEVDAFNFKPYEYTDLDCLQTYEKTEVCNITINTAFKIKNSVLYINDKQYELGDKTLLEVYNIVNLYGTMKFFSGYEVFRKLPAILLNDCTNSTITTFDGDVSPTDVSQLNHNKSLVTITDSVGLVTIFDYDSNVEKDFTRVNTKLFFNPSTTTKIHVHKLSTNFNLTIDMSPRRITNANIVSSLLNYGDVL